MRTGKIEVYLEAIKFAPACNKVLSKLFLKADTIVLFPTSGYSGNVSRYS